LRLQKYAEVAENSLRLIKNVSITKTWFFKLLQVARLMAYPETSNRHQISASPLGNLSLKKVAYLHDSLRVLFQKKIFTVI
jgi:hypothetical protein